MSETCDDEARSLAALGVSLCFSTAVCIVLTDSSPKERFGYFIALASSPKRVLRTMKRGEDGAAVKVSRRSKAQRNFGNRKRSNKARAFGAGRF